MERLIRGIVHFRTHELPSRREMFARLAHGQSPDVLFIACSDSRVVPNLLSTTEPGDLFAVRTVGNLIAPSERGDVIGDVSEGAAVEYAISVLGVQHIVMCGHSRCGAMDAALKGTPPGLPNLAAWLENAKPSVERFKTQAHFADAGLAPADRLSQINVLQQLDHLRTYAPVREREAAGKLVLWGFWFDVASAETYVFDLERGGYVRIDEDEGNRILERQIPPAHFT